MRLTTFISLSWLLFGCTDELVSTPDGATQDQRQKDASRLDSAAEGEGGCVPYKGPGLMPIIGVLDVGTKTLGVPPRGDDIPMEVFGSYTWALQLASADADAGADAGLQRGLQILLVGEMAQRAPVPLPLLEPGHKVLLTVRQWGGYANYQWFVVVRDAGSRELLLALHMGDLELFGAGFFRESKALGFGFSLSELCTRFDPQFGCTPKGGYVTELAIDVNGGDDGGSIRIFSGETRTITVGGREHSVFLSGARRTQTDDTVGCMEFAPGNGGLGMAVW
jgi:hypothetical protein